jgi:hypothetical protein
MARLAVQPSRLKSTERLERTSRLSHGPKEFRLLSRHDLSLSLSLARRGETRKNKNEPQNAPSPLLTEKKEIHARIHSLHFTTKNIHYVFEETSPSFIGESTRWPVKGDTPLSLPTHTLEEKTFNIEVALGEGVAAAKVVQRKE